jgi:large subunit ribosomal protein L10
LQGENAWIFVSEDAISDTIKHYFKFEDDLFAEAKKVAPKNVEVKKPTEVSVVVMDNKLLSAKEVRCRQ